LSDLERPDVRNQFFFRRILITLVRSATSLHLHKCVARFVSDSRVSCLLIAPGRKKDGAFECFFFGNNTDYYCLRRRRFCFTRCSFVYLTVSKFTYETTDRIFLKIFIRDVSFKLWTRKPSLNFGSRPDMYTDRGII